MGKPTRVVTGSPPPMPATLHIYGEYKHSTLLNIYLGQSFLIPHMTLPSYLVFHVKPPGMDASWSTLMVRQQP